MFFAVKASGEREFYSDAKKLADGVSRTIKADVPVTVDTRGAVGPIAAVQGQSAKLASSLKNIPVTADTRGASTPLTGLQGQTDKLAKSLTGMKASVDDTRARTPLASLKLMQEGLAKALTGMTASVTGKAAEAELLKLQVASDKLAAKIASMPADADTRPAQAALLGLEARADRLAAKLDKMPASVDVTRAAAELEAFRLEEAARPIQLTATAGVAGGAAGLAGAAAGLAGAAPGAAALGAVGGGDVAVRRALANMAKLEVQWDRLQARMERANIPAAIISGNVTRQMEADLLKRDELVARYAREQEKHAKALQASGKTIEDSGLKIAGGLSGIGDALGKSSTGFLALVAAGIALSPVLVTVGAGLTGIGLAAASVLGPIFKAGTATKQQRDALASLDPMQRQAYDSLTDLKKGFADFGKSLEPTVLDLFTKGLDIAAGLMQDLKPVAETTGKALGGLLDRVDAEFRSGTWQQFFAFMGEKAARDIDLLGRLLVALLDAIPPLLMALQPVAETLLRTAGNVAELVGALARLPGAFNTAADTISRYTGQADKAAKSHNAFGEAAKRATDQLLGHVIPGYDKFTPILHKVWDYMTKSGDATDKTAGHVKQLHVNTDLLGASSSASAPLVQQLASQVYVEGANADYTQSNINKINQAWDGFLARSTSLVTAQLGVTGALKTMNDQAKIDGATFSGVNDQSIALQQTFENAVVPGVQGIIDKMREAHAPAKDLALVVATDVTPAMKDGALKSDVYRAQIYALAVQAGYTGPNKIGPLTEWIKKNSGTMQQAKDDADKYAASLAKIPSTVGTTIKMNAQGTLYGTTPGVQKVLHDAGLTRAGGGYIAQGTGPTADDVPAWLSRGELVVPAHMVSSGAVDHLRGSLPGFAAGGTVGAVPAWPDPRLHAALYGVVPRYGSAEVTPHGARGLYLPGFASGGLVSGSYANGLPGMTAWLDASLPVMTDAMTAALGAAIGKAYGKAMAPAIAAAQAGMGGPAAGRSVLAYAGQYANKVPYVWGGSSPVTGWDCSGFVSWVYNHLGIYNGRTTAAGFQGWAKPSGAVPGGLVFFGSPAHHVGFTVNDRTMLSALGRQWGTIYSSLAGNSGFGIPPQWAAQMRGIPGGLGFAPGPAATGSAAAAQALARSLLWAYGWGQNQWPYLQRLWQQESSWSAYAVNRSSGAYGIPQALPSVWDHPYALGDYANQVRWGLAYISGRYPGGPAQAWAHEVAHNWYARGGGVGALAHGGLPPPSRRWAERLERAQSAEEHQYHGLTRAFASDFRNLAGHPWVAHHHAAVAASLKKLAALQKREEHAFHALLSGPRGIRMETRVPLMEAAKAELAGVKDSTLAEFAVVRDKHGRPVMHHGHPVRHMIGGHGGWRDLLAHWLIQVRADAANQPPAWETPGRPPFLPPAPHLAAVAREFSFDRGGVLKPGPNLTWNLTGRDEHLVPADSAGMTMNVTVNINAPVGSRAELENWFVQTLDKVARQGRATYALRRSPSVG